MKVFIHKLLANRLFWFLCGVIFIPVATTILPYPKGISAKEAMGNVSYYEESKLLFTFLGDHSYKLKFPGDRYDFESFVTAMGLDDNKVNENLYKYEDSEQDWIEEISFHEDDKLKNIHYSSDSW